VWNILCKLIKMLHLVLMSVETSLTIITMLAQMTSTMTQFISGYSAKYILDFHENCLLINGSVKSLDCNRRSRKDMVSQNIRFLGHPIYQQINITLAKDCLPIFISRQQCRGGWLCTRFLYRYVCVSLCVSVCSHFCKQLTRKLIYGFLQYS